MNFARRRIAGAGLLIALLAAASRAPAVAVDRSLGAGIPKPAASGAAWSSAAVSQLKIDLDTLLAGAPTLRGAHVGLLVIETRSGRVLYARNADDAFQPASTLKLLTGSVALWTLTPSFRFRTEALLDPAAATLYVRGGGDPLLNVADLDAMAQSARTAGVTALGAGVRVDASAFEADPYPPGWSWDDLINDYAPALSAASVAENLVQLTITPGAAAGASVAVSGAPPPFENIARTVDAAAGPAPCHQTSAIVVDVLATTAPHDAENTVDVQRFPGGCIAVTGAVPLGSAPQTIEAAVPDPVWYVHALAQAALERAGISLPELIDGNGAAGVPAGGRIIWSHDGEPLADLLADLWWPSDNFVAELLLKSVGLHARGAPGTTKNGADAERAWLGRIGIDPATVTLVDGSGLSTYDRITPRALAAILQADWNGPFRDVVLDDLPLAGVRGTLHASFAGSLAERRTFAKDGRVNHTRGLAGYLATLRHGALTFAWSVDDWMGNDPDLNVLRARVLSRLIGD